MHFVQRLFQNFRQETDELFGDCENLAPGYKKELIGRATPENLPRLTDSLSMIPLLGAIPLSMAYKAHGQDFALIVGSETAFWAAYRSSQSIYQISPSIWSRMEQRPITTIPAENFRLPANGMVVTVNKSAFGLYYDLSIGREETGALDVRVVTIADTDPAVLPLCVFDLHNSDTIESAFVGAMAKIEAKASGIVNGLRPTDQCRALINSLLYITVGVEVVKVPTIARPNIFKVGR